MELQGKLIKILPEVKGEGKNGPWIKQDFVIETFGEYPKTVALEAWGDHAETAKRTAIGTVITVKFSPESKEYNDRWYTALRAYTITKD